MYINQCQLYGDKEKSNDFFTEYFPVAASETKTDEGFPK